MSNQRNINSYYEISQDIDSLKSTWSFNWGTGWSRTTWRIAQISRIGVHNNPYCERVLGLQADGGLEDHSECRKFHSLSL